VLEIRGWTVEQASNRSLIRANSAASSKRSFSSSESAVNRDLKLPECSEWGRFGKI
jgi:hypothetical protein